MSQSDFHCFLIRLGYILILYANRINEGSVDLKSCSRGKGIHKYAEVTLKIYLEIFEKPWKYGKITKFCDRGKVGTLQSYLWQWKNHKHPLTSTVKISTALFWVVIHETWFGMLYQQYQQLYSELSYMKHDSVCSYMENFIFVRTPTTSPVNQKKLLSPQQVVFRKPADYKL